MSDSGLFIDGDFGLRFANRKKPCILSFFELLICDDVALSPGEKEAEVEDEPNDMDELFRRMLGGGACETDRPFWYGGETGEPGID